MCRGVARMARMAQHSIILQAAVYWIAQYSIGFRTIQSGSKDVLHAALEEEEMTSELGFSKSPYF
jgi:hypothetical protein